MSNELFFELIQVAIGRRTRLSRVPTAEEWNLLYLTAEKQAVLGVCFAGVNSLPKELTLTMPMPLKMKWLAVSARIQQRNELMNRRCIEVQKALQAEGLSPSILKGQGMTSLYKISDGESENLCYSLGKLRQSGDIDVWVPCGMESAMAFIIGKYGKVEYDYINAHVPMFNDVEVELHWRAGAVTNLLMNRRLQRWLERKETKKMMLAGKAILPDGGEITVPSIEFNLYYLMLHCYHHVFETGLGMRQLMDYYFLLRARNLNLCDNHIELFRNFGMQRFVCAVMWIMQEVFGLEKNRLLDEPNERDGRFILREIMDGGNFGHHEGRIRRFTKSKKWHSICSILQHNFHISMHYPLESFWSVVWIVYHFFWKKTHKI